jgi:Niemann-Pick C1 protein
VFASHPAIVLFTSSWIVAALGYGAFNLQVTTDPVEIWAAPQSRSRLEKDYFDSRFEPFYRTEQVFIKAVGIDKVCTCVSLPLQLQFTHYQLFHTAKLLCFVYVRP